MSTHPDQDAVKSLYQAIRLVRPIHLNVARVVERQLEGTGITVPMRAVLELLVEEGPSSGPQIAARLSLKRQFVHRTISVLREAGLVERRDNELHKRSDLFVPSAAGRAAFKRIHSHELRVLAEQMNDVSDADIAAVHKVLALVDRVFSDLAKEEI